MANLWFDIRNALVAEIQTIDDIGYVVGRLRYVPTEKEFAETYVGTFDGKPQARAWHVTLDSTDLRHADEELMSGTINYIVHGWVGLQDDEDSESDLYALAWEIISTTARQVWALDAGALEVRPPNVRNTDVVTIGNLMANYIEVVIPVVVDVVNG